MSAIFKFYSHLLLTTLLITLSVLAKNETSRSYNYPHTIRSQLNIRMSEVEKQNLDRTGSFLEDKDSDSSARRQAYGFSHPTKHFQELQYQKQFLASQEAKPQEDQREIHQPVLVYVSQDPISTPIALQNQNQNCISVMVGGSWLVQIPVPQHVHPDEIRIHLPADLFMPTDEAIAHVSSVDQNPATVLCPPNQIQVPYQIIGSLNPVGQQIRSQSDFTDLHTGTDNMNAEYDHVSSTGFSTSAESNTMRDNLPTKATETRILSFPQLISNRNVQTQTTGSAQHHPSDCNYPGCRAVFVWSTNFKLNLVDREENDTFPRYSPASGTTVRNTAAMDHRYRPHKLLKCPVCLKMFCRKDLLKSHQQVHNRQFRYRCAFPGCGQKFVNTDNFREHFRKKHLNRTFRCLISECEKAFTMGRLLLRHYRSHIRNVTNCQQCVEFDARYLYRQGNFRKKPTDDENLFRCDNCQEKFAEEEFESHQETHKEPCPWSNCRKASLTYALNRQLEQTK